VTLKLARACHRDVSPTSALERPNSAYTDGRCVNTLNGADSTAPSGGAAFHDNKVWLQKLA
jgi:hypothetical protein